MKFSENIKNLRKCAGLTQQQLSSNLGITASAIGFLENEQREPTANTVLRYANYFEVSTDYLLGLEDDFGAISIQTKKNAELSPDEKAIIENFRKLSPDLMHRASTYMQKLLELENDNDIFYQLKNSPKGDYK